MQQQKQNKKQKIYLIIMKQLEQQHIAITHTIDTILTKGSQKLYQSYIKQKLPNHTSQQTNNSLHISFSIPYQDSPTNVDICKDYIPKGELKESIIPKRVRKEMNKSMVEDSGSMGIGNLSFVKTNNQKYRNPSGVMTQRISVKKYTPKIRQKISINCKSLLNPEQQKTPDTDLTLRLQKKQREKKQQQILQQQHKKQQQKTSTRKKLQSHIQQLQILGIPYVYEDDGTIHSPEISSFKYAKAKNQFLLRKKERIAGLKHETIDVGSFQRYVKDSRVVVGRKRGYFSSQFYKRLKMTNEEFNNQNGRQNSNIPFLSLTQGVRIVQRQRNIIAQKTKKPIPTLFQFRQKTQSNMFKSYLPEFDTQAMQTNTIDRPLTTGQFSRSKKTPETTITKMNNSILWRPKTTSKGCRLNINNEQLAKDVLLMGQQ